MQGSHSKQEGEKTNHTHDQKYKKITSSGVKSYGEGKADGEQETSKETSCRAGLSENHGPFSAGRLRWSVGREQGRRLDSVILGVPWVLTGLASESPKSVSVISMHRSGLVIISWDGKAET